MLQNCPLRCFSVAMEGNLGREHYWPGRTAAVCLWTSRTGAAAAAAAAVAAAATGGSIAPRSPAANNKGQIKVKSLPAARRGHGRYHVGSLAGLGYEPCMHQHRRRLVAIATALERRGRNRDLVVTFASPLQQAQRLRHRPAPPCTILAATTHKEPGQSALHPQLGLHSTRRIIKGGISKRGWQGRDVVDATLGPRPR